MSYASGQPTCQTSVTCQRTPNQRAVSSGHHVTLLTHKNVRWDCYGTACLTPSLTGSATQNTLNSPFAAFIEFWHDNMILSASSFHTLPEPRFLSSVSGTRRETGMTHSCQRTYYSHSMSGRVNFIDSLPSHSHGAMFSLAHSLRGPHKPYTSSQMRQREHMDQWPT